MEGTRRKDKCPGPFAKLLESKGICAQYTMPGSPQQNGVAERRNRTLLDMVRSMLAYCSLPLSMWTYALRTAMYLLNRLPSKAVPTTPFELWTNRKPSLRHLHVFGCPAEVRVYNPHEKKLDSKTISGFFIGYPEKSKGYRFYCPSHSTRILESGNAHFIEDGEVSGSVVPRQVDIKEVKEKHSLTSTSINVENTLTQVIVLIIVLRDNNSQEQVTSDDRQPQNDNVDDNINNNGNDGNANENVDNNDGHNLNENENANNAQQQTQEVVLRRSSRPRKTTVRDEFVYVQEEGDECNDDVDIVLDDDPVSFKEAIESDNSSKWLDAMNEELKSMDHNEV